MGGPARRAAVFREIIVAGFSLLALLVAQWMLSSAIHGTNYDGGDGKMSQATILAALKFGGLFQVTNINPIEGVGSQLLPLNVWLNPAHWPFHILGQAPATDVSALIALGLFRNFLLRHGAVLRTANGAQRCRCATVHRAVCTGGTRPAAIDGLLHNARQRCGLCATYDCARAPSSPRPGIVAQIRFGDRRHLRAPTLQPFCDPLWTTINGFSWSVAFAVVTLSPLKLKPILIRAGALGCCTALLFLTGALEYVFTLSRYTARFQFAAVVDRPRLVPFVSAAFYSATAKYYYLTCVSGWLLGFLTLRGRPRVLVVAAGATCVLFVAYSIGFMLLNVPWTAPIPVYVEHCLFPLFLTAAVAGYWGALRAATSWLRRPVAAVIVRAVPLTARIILGIATLVQRVRITAIHRGIPRLALYFWPLSRSVRSPSGARDPNNPHSYSGSRGQNRRCKRSRKGVSRRL